MPKFLKSYASEARTTLARLLDARTEAAEEANEARARIARLECLAHSAEQVRAKLSALDAEEAARYSAWSRDASLPAPSPDTTKRTDLSRELSEAQSRSDAAHRAMAVMRGEVDAAIAKSNAAESALNFAAAHVALEEMADIATEARAAVAKLAEARMKGHALARVLGNVSNAMGPAAPGFAEYRTSYAAAGDALRLAFELPRITEADEYAFLAAINRLLMALKNDAAARLTEVA
jgi:hypothetical protein